MDWVGSALLSILTRSSIRGAIRQGVLPSLGYYRQYHLHCLVCLLHIQAVYYIAN